MIGKHLRKGHRVGRNFLHTAATRFTYQVHTRCGRTFPGDSLKIEQGHQTVTMHARTLILTLILTLNLNPVHNPIPNPKPYH